MLLSIISEFLGTFFFLSSILIVKEPIAIAISLLAVIYIFGNISGGHFNPAVTTMMYAKGKINMITLICYIIAQILGGLVALLWYKFTKSYKK